MSLSARFSKLQKSNVGGNTNRKFATFNKQKSVRSAGMNAKRGIVNNLMNNKMKSNQKKVQNTRVAVQSAVKKAIKKAVSQVGGAKKRPNSASSVKSKNPTPKKAATKKPATKKPVAKKAAAAPKPTNDDLDMEMDKCKCTSAVFIRVSCVYIICARMFGDH
jgi:hypothetical protein